MLLWLLLLHLAIHLLTATRHAPSTKTITGRPIDKKYVVKRIQSCPDVGYFFKREPAPNSLTPGPCLLCFCQDQKTAVCWRRENKRCDVESFHYHGLGKRDTRVRRSPAGFSDIFFRDATRDVFNKGAKQQCKPYESSFSDGCPPADWCIGCTVCDCDANGRWDCHILSFCPDKKGGNNMKKRKQHVRTPNIRPIIPPRKSTTTGPRSRLTTVKRAGRYKSQTKRVARVANKAPPKGRIVKKSAPRETTKHPKKKPPLKFRKIAPKNSTAGPKIINKNVATHNPVDMVNRSKMQKVLNTNNETVKIAQQVVKRVMAAVQKMVKNEMRNLTKLINPKPMAYKKVNKRHVSKGIGKKPHLKKFLIRNKRNVMPIGDIDFNMTVADVSENTTADASVTAITSIESTSSTPDRTYTTATTTTLNDSEYYKYTVGVDHLTTDKPIVVNDVDQIEAVVNTYKPIVVNNVDQIGAVVNTYKPIIVNDVDQIEAVVNTYKPIVVNDLDQTGAVVNIMSTERLKNLAFDRVNDDGNEITSFLDAMPDLNDLKFKKWSFVKILKEKHDPNRIRNVEKLLKNKPVGFLRTKNKVHTKDVERKLVSKKFNVIKVVNSHKIGQENAKQNQSAVQMIRSKVSDLQTSVSKLFSKLHNNNAVVLKTKHRRVGIVKYLKKLFTKIFNGKKPGRQGMNDFKVIEALCDQFGPCKVNMRDKIRLKSKLKKLNVETQNILKTIQIIKGLLQFVNISTPNDESGSKPNFSSDIQKLNNILRGTYVKPDSIPLTATEITQIDYIKKNTKHFVTSVSNFATLLNEIVAVLIKNNTENFHRMLRDIDHKMEEDPFHNFRSLLMRYNLVQNDFMKRMYRQLSELENKMKEKKVSDNEYTDLNNNVAIERFSTNIITNLRQLRQVAQTLTSSGRVRRDTVLKEDSIEYVLMVMEYLMKQNHPLDSSPANDGIDLLIDAIRNAPDIKPIKKKVLEYPRATPIQSESVQKSDSSEDNVSGDDKRSKDDSKINIDNSKDLVDQIIEEDKDSEEKFQYDRKVDDTTEAVFFGRAEDTPNTEIDVIIETTSESPATVVLQTVKEANDDTVTVKAYKDIDNFNKTSDVGDNYEKKFDESGESNGVALPTDFPPSIENEVLPLVHTTPFTEGIETREPAIETEVANMRNYLDQSFESKETKFKFDTKSQIDWIEENFGVDASRLNMSRINTTVRKNITIVEDKTSNPIKYDVSGMKNEVDERKKKKINAEEVMLKKQMDFLNSLDYGTEKSEIEESDSKDANDDKFSSDSFPTYFV